MQTTMLIVFKRIAYTLFLTLFSFQFNNIFAQPTLDQLRQLWHNRDYISALQGLKDYRASNTHNVEIDYMIATSACRIPEKRQTAVKVFDWILKYYPLTQENYNVVQGEINLCSDNSSSPTNFVASKMIYANVSSISSKILHTHSSESKNGVATKSFEIIREIPLQEFTKRLFSLDLGIEAESAITSRMNCPRVTLTDNFVVCSYEGNPNIYHLGDELQKILKFYCKNYNFNKPEYFISVYVAENANHLRDLARILHGLEIPSGSGESCIGYSFHQDLSLAAIMQSYSGTFRHELFHLLAHIDFGDIPPWLDEGIAALYEVSKFTNDSTLTGQTNWRAEILDKLWDERPEINKMINMNWSEFNSEEGIVELQAVNHATARYFAFYLQEKGKLYDIYKAFRDRDIFNINENLEDNSLAQVESILGQNFNQTETEFSDFCKTKIYEYYHNY